MTPSFVFPTDIFFQTLQEKATMTSISVILGNALMIGLIATLTILIFLHPNNFVDPVPFEGASGSSGMSGASGAAIGIQQGLFLGISNPIVVNPGSNVWITSHSFASTTDANTGLSGANDLVISPSITYGTLIVHGQWQNLTASSATFTIQPYFGDGSYNGAATALGNPYTVSVAGSTTVNQGSIAIPASVPVTLLQGYRMGTMVTSTQAVQINAASLTWLFTTGP